MPKPIEAVALPHYGGFIFISKGRLFFGPLNSDGSIWEEEECCEIDPKDVAIKDFFDDVDLGIEEA